MYGIELRKEDSYWEPVAIHLINSIIIINGAKPAVNKIKCKTEAA